MAQCYRNSGSLKNGMVAQAHRTSGSFAPRLFTSFGDLLGIVFEYYYSINKNKMKVRQKKSYVKIFWIVNFFWKELLEKMKVKIKK